MKLGIGILALLSSFASAAIEPLGLPLMPFAVSTRLSFVEGAQNAAKEVWKGIEACGLEVRDAYDPALPKPQFIALTAIVARYQTSQESFADAYRVLAYYNEEDVGTTFAWKATNGGNVHSISFSETGISFTTPLAGQVAWANRYFDPEGMKYNFWLRGISGTVAYPVWHQGVQQRFINKLVGNLCAFAKSRPRINLVEPKL